MPKPLVSGLGSWRHGAGWPGWRANNKLTISAVQGSRRSRVPFLRQMAAGSPYWIGRMDTTAHPGGSRR